MRKTKGRREHPGGEGIRRRYRDMLDPERFRFPRQGLVHHPAPWYLSDAPLKRPVFGAYALAAYAESLLWRAMHARRGPRPGYADAARFFAASRRTLQNILSTYPIGRRLTARQAGSVRRAVARLRDAAARCVPARPDVV